MYKDYREPKINIEIDVVSYEETCGGCPTIYCFKDDEGTSYYFHLRYGEAKLVCEDTKEILISGLMSGRDGICDWDDFVKWSRKNGVLIN